MSYAAGKLRHRVEIQQQITTVTSYGEQETIWTHVADVWAAIEPLSGREFIAAGATQSKVVGRIVMRYRDGIRASMRILHKSKTYNVEGVLSDKESGIEYLTLPVSEGVIDGSPVTTIIDGGSP